MPQYDFDEVIPRRGTGSVKWQMFGDDVLPLWVADMDFRLPQEIIDAIKARAEHGMFGYDFFMPDVNEVICQRMKTLYDWDIEPDWIIHMPGVIAGISMACKTFGEHGHKALFHTPVYFPFYNVTKAQGMQPNTVELDLVEDGDLLRYELDFDTFESAITDDTDLFILCNPHNPVGRVWTRDELQRMADSCLKHDIMIISDEIHCDLLFDDHVHVPIAALSKEIEAKTITLMAASKTFNMPGLGDAYAIVADKDMREQLGAAMWGIGAHAFVMGLIGTKAAYEHGADWLQQALAYMQANRDYVIDYLKEHLPQIKTTSPEGTYLMWLDCRALPLGDELPGKFFMEQAKVAFNEGQIFGESGTGFVRLNLACPRSILTQGLDQMREAIAGLE